MTNLFKELYTRLHTTICLIKIIEIKLLLKVYRHENDLKYIWHMYLLFFTIISAKKRIYQYMYQLADVKVYCTVQY